MGNKHTVISIHALREEGDLEQRNRRGHRQPISIHALREEGDYCKKTKREQEYISIHALREEGDPYCNCRSNPPY